MFDAWLTCRTIGSCSGGCLSLEPCCSHSSKAVNCSEKKGLGWNSASDPSSTSLYGTPNDNAWDLQRAFRLFAHGVHIFGCVDVAHDSCAAPQGNKICPDSCHKDDRVRRTSHGHRLATRCCSHMLVVQKPHAICMALASLSKLAVVTKASAV